MNKQLDLESENKRKEREEYYLRKAKLQELEKGNYGKIIFMKGTGKFWVVCGHSAVILANKIGQELKMRIPLKSDTDFNFRFKEGKVSVANLDYYKTQLAKVKDLKLETENGEFCVFKFKKNLPETEYEILAQTKELKKKQLEELTLKSITMPKTHMVLTDLVRVAFKIYEKYTEKDAKEIFGKRLMDELRSAHKVFLLICVEEMPIDDGVDKVCKYLLRAQMSVTQMAGLSLWNIEDATSVSKAIVETRLCIVREKAQAEKLLEKLNKIRKGEETNEN